MSERYYFEYLQPLSKGDEVGGIVHSIISFVDLPYWFKAGFLHKILEIF